MDWIFTLAFAGALDSGLMAGMFYVFSICIIPALGRLSHESVEGADLWQRYLPEWTSWNHLRAVAGFLWLAAFVYAAAEA